MKHRNLKTPAAFHGASLIKKILILLILAVILTNVAVKPAYIYTAGITPQKNAWDIYLKYLPIIKPSKGNQLRGVWISTVINLDWPSKETSLINNNNERIAKSKKELINILDSAVLNNLNAVFFQVSPEGDAMYKSAIVPYSRYLTGVYGKDPGFDPLSFAIKEAHRRKLQIHAWFNPYRVSMYTDSTTLKSMNVKKSVLAENPGWVKNSGDRLVVDPGIPDARKWVMARVMEVVGKYDIDGIHFDDYFYHEKYVGELKDDDTFKRYNNNKFKYKADFRRNSTYQLIKELNSSIKKKKPKIKFGISPSAVWGNKKDGHADGSNTNSYLTNYDKSFADTKKWVKEALIDYIAPQVYFSFSDKNVPYGTIASWWANVCKGGKVQLYIGLPLYKVNDSNDIYLKGNNAIAEIERQINFNIRYPYIKGSIFFRAKNLTDKSKQPVLENLRGNLWSKKVMVPY